MCVHAPLCSTLCHPMDCNPLGSSIYGISQALMLEWGAIPFSREKTTFRRNETAARSEGCPTSLIRGIYGIIICYRVEILAFYVLTRSEYSLDLNSERVKVRS